MGISFLKRKKKNAPSSLQIDTSDEALIRNTASGSMKDDASVSRFAILQPATSIGGTDESATGSVSRSGDGESPAPAANLVTPTKGTAGEEQVDNGSSVEGYSVVEVGGNISAKGGTSQVAETQGEFSMPMPALVSPISCACVDVDSNASAAVAVPMVCAGQQPDETPVISNQMSTLSKDVDGFNANDSGEEVDADDAFAKLAGERSSGRNADFPEPKKSARSGVSIGSKKSKKSKKKSKKEKNKKTMSMRFGLSPSKKDTPHIEIPTPTTPETSPEQEIHQPINAVSQYNTSILDDYYNDYGSQGSGGGVELGIAGQQYSYNDRSNRSSGGSKATGNNDADATLHSRSTSKGASRDTRSTMKQKNLTTKAVANHTGQGAAYVGGALQLPQANIAAEAAELNASFEVDLEEAEDQGNSKKSNYLLSRLRSKSSRSRSISKKVSQTAPIARVNDGQQPVVISPVVSASQSFQNEVPKVINHDDDATMPSLLTEPEARARMSTPVPATAELTSPGSIAPRGSSGTQTPTSKSQLPSLACTSGETGTYPGTHTTASRTGASETFFGATTLEGMTTMASTAMSSATAYGGIDKFLGAFSCGNNDATLGETVRKVLTCDAVCNPVCGGTGQVREKDGVDLKLEQEERDTLDFQSDIIKNGVKLIYHESPSRASTNPDWIQSTVKLFLRPGNCHGTHLVQPTLAWAVLPVVSRRQMVGASFDSDENMWNTLGLLDVHSILVDEGEAANKTGNIDAGGSTNPEGERTNNNSATAATSTGFFSITATTGAVYVFEAPSAKARDYVVRGLRNVVARLTYNMIAGNADVIGELFSEDAGQLTGELPSLVSPWRALGGVTHAFLDQQ